MINEYLNKAIKSICKIDINQLIIDLSEEKQTTISLKDKIIKLRNVNDERANQIGLLETEISSQKDKLYTLQNLNIELSSSLESNRAKIVSLQDEKSHLSSDIANNLQKINELNLQNTTLQEQLHQTKSTLQDSCKEYTRLQEYTDQMRTKCSDLERNMLRISDEKDILLNNIAELKHQLINCNREIENLKEKDNQASARNEELLRERTHLYEDILTIRTEKNSVLQKLEEERAINKQQQEQHQKTIDSLSLENGTLLSQVGMLQNNITDYLSKIETLEEENLKLSDSNETLRTNYASLQEVYSKEQVEGTFVEESEVGVISEGSTTHVVAEVVSEVPESTGQDLSEKGTDSVKDKSEGTSINIITPNEEETIPSAIRKEQVDGDSVKEDVNFSAEVVSEVPESTGQDLSEKGTDSVKDKSEETSVNTIPPNEEETIPSAFRKEQVEGDSVEGPEDEDFPEPSTVQVSADMDVEDKDDEQEDDGLPYFYDDSLVPADKLSIPEVYDVKEGKTINSREFFRQNENELILWRRSLQEEYLMGHTRFICPECKQPVKISGHKLARGRVCYFAHFKDSDDCQYKTGTHRTKEEIERQKYSLVQESERHKRLKAAIASALKDELSRSKGIENVECEKRINSDIPYLNWRRPDIYAEYNGRKYVFELQL